MSSGTSESCSFSCVLNHLTRLRPYHMSYCWELMLLALLPNSFEDGGFCRTLSFQMVVEWQLAQHISAPPDA